MDMTYHQYIQNPMGIKNSVISNREMYRLMYTQKWDTIKLRENGEIRYDLYKSSTDYYLYIKIPSEVISNFYYDVVIRFYPPKASKAPVASATLEGYLVQFFSNDPSFVFTFAHAFVKNDMFLKDLSPRMSKLALKQTASERNPTNQVGYVKSLYFAYLEMKNKGLFSKLKWMTAKKYEKDRLLTMIVPADVKIDQRQKAETEAQKKKKHNERANPSKQNKPESKLANPITNTSRNHMISPKSKIGGKSKISGKSKITGKK